MHSTVRQSEGGGRGGWLGPPSSQGPPMVPAEGEPKVLKLKPSWRRRRRSKILAVSPKHWKGRRGVQGGVHPPPPTRYGRSNTSLRLGPARPAEGVGGVGVGGHFVVLLSAAGGAYWPLATSLALPLNPLPPQAAVPIGLSPPLPLPGLPSPPHTPFHSLGRLRQWALALSLFHCSVSGPLGGGQRRSPLARGV